MSRESPRYGPVQVEPGDRTMWARLDDARAVPLWFVASIGVRRPRCRVVLEVRSDPTLGRPVVQELTVRRDRDTLPFGPPIMSSVLAALSVPELLDVAVERAAEPLVNLPDRDGWTGLFRLARDDSGMGYGGRRVGSPRVRSGGDDALLRRVGELHEQVTSRGSRRPTMDVAERLGFSRAHAARLIRRAREAGYIS